MKVSRYVKLRALAGSPIDVALEQNHNPLRKKVPVAETTREYAERLLADYRTPLDLEHARTEP